MDKIASPYLEEFILRYSEPLRKEQQKIKNITAQLILVQNCCDSCRGAWRYHHGIVADIMNGFTPGVHPAESVLDGVTRIRNLAGSFVTPQDEQKIGGNILSVKNSNRDFLYESLLLRVSGIKTQQLSSGDRALIHLMAQDLMEQRLNNDLKNQILLALNARINAYYPETTGLYPYRTPAGKPLKIKAIHPFSCGEKKYSSALVTPFIKFSLDPLARLKLYASLSVQQFQIDDLPYHKEHYVGQWYVTASQPISAGACVGVHAGTLVPENFESFCKTLSPEPGDAVANGGYLRNDRIIDIARHCASVGSNSATLPIYLDRDGIISKINTRPSYDKMNDYTGKTENNYNVEAAKFTAELEDNRKVYVIGIFALKNIDVGDELRGDIT